MGKEEVKPLADVMRGTAARTVAALLIAALALTACAGLSVSPQARADFNAGLVLFDQGRFAEARSFFEKAAAQEPDYYEAQFYLGRTFLNMKEYGKALPALRRAYRLSPDNFKSQAADLLIDALLGAAFSELGKGNFEGSLTYLREVLSHDPRAKKIKDDLSNVLVAVGTGLFMKGDVRDAVQAFSDAIKANPDNVKAYVGLARALIKSGAVAEAIENAQKALSLDPLSSDALSLIRELFR